MARVIVAMILLAASVVIGAGTGNAAFPGLNGRVVFASNRSPLIPGELYSAAATGGSLRRLTSNWVEETSPAASPVDGRIAFGRRGWIFIRTSRGRERAVARVRGLRHGPLWSPDGRLVLYTAGQGGPNLDVFVVEASGGTRRRLGSQHAERGPPSWSPDSRRVALVGRDSQIAVVSISTGKRTRLTHGSTIHSRPTWSPDGTRMAYFRAGRRSGIFVLHLPSRRILRVSSMYLGESADGLAWAPHGPRLLVTDSTNGRADVVPLRGRPTLVSKRARAATWSPDGSRIAYRSGSNDNELWVTRASGKDKRRLVRLPPGHRFLGHTWTADRRRIVYGQFVDDEFVDNDLYAMRPDGSGLRALTHNSVEETGPSFSPDGTQLAYACGTNLCVLDLTTGSRRRLASGLLNYGHPSWSPDGSRLVFSRARRNPNNPDNPFGDLYVVAADGSGLSVLTREAYGPAWSPDGRRIAFSRLHEFGENVHVLELADGSERNVSNQPWWHERFGFFDTKPDWSPVADTLVMESMRGIGDEGCDPFCPPVDLFTVPSTGGEVLRITHSQGSFDPAWSPDGRRIVYSDDGSISVVGSAGGKPRRLTRGPGVDLSPSWQPLCTRHGTAGANSVSGTPRDDVLCGFGGNDTVDGNAGSDRLFGGRGADSLRAQDGEWDVVGCGPGRDVAFADEIDLVGFDCEDVRRR